MYYKDYSELDCCFLEVSKHLLQEERMLEKAGLHCNFGNISRAELVDSIRSILTLVNVLSLFLFSQLPTF